MSIVSDEQVRELSLVDLGLSKLAEDVNLQSSSLADLDESELDSADPILSAARVAQEMGYAGILLSGSPGTGKSWYAQQIAVALSGRWEAVRSIQFHPSYQYEDFVFGYSPKKEGGFELRVREFARICRDAASDPEVTYVLVIDEISRTDVVRVFGEALTYIETDKRNQPFETASGEELSIPQNVVLIGTMNDWDKGVDELDVALERRFAEIRLEPNVEVLERLLLANGAKRHFAERIISFFSAIQDLEMESVHVGHAYFLRCTDVKSAKWEWIFRLGPTFRRACRHEPNVLQKIEELWKETVDEDDPADA